MGAVLHAIKCSGLQHEVNTLFTFKNDITNCLHRLNIAADVQWNNEHINKFHLEQVAQGMVKFISVTRYEDTNYEKYIFQLRQVNAMTGKVEHNAVIFRSTRVKHNLIQYSFKHNNYIIYDCYKS